MIIFNRRTFIPSFVAGALIATSAAAQTEIKLGHVGEPGSLVGAVADEFAKRANERLAGKAKVIVYGSSQLGGDSDMMKKLKLGTIDLSEPSTVLSSYVASVSSRCLISSRTAST